MELEFSTLKSPLEGLKREHRTVSPLLSHLTKANLSTAQTRLTKSHTTTTTLLANLRTRIERLQQDSHKLPLQLVHHFLRAQPPLLQSALALIDAFDLASAVQQSLWTTLHTIQAELANRNTAKLQLWIKQNKSQLAKQSSKLEFQLHLQEFIELCRTGDSIKGIIYAQMYLSPFVSGIKEGEESEEMVQVSQVMSLLAYPPNTTCLPYRDLYSSHRWTNLITLFRTTFLALHSLPPVPLLHLSLQAGLASLKTSICCPLPPTTAPAVPAPAPTPAPVQHYQAEDNSLQFTSMGFPVLMRSTPSPSAPAAPVPEPKMMDTAPETNPAPDCPICSSPLRELAKEVPYSHHTNTTIVCGISGKVVEGDGGQLIALVSRVTGVANVYSKEALVLQSSTHRAGKIIDPKNGEEFTWDETRKVYII